MVADVSGTVVGQAAQRFEGVVAALQFGQLLEEADGLLASEGELGLHLVEVVICYKTTDSRVRGNRSGGSHPT